MRAIFLIVVFAGSFLMTSAQSPLPTDTFLKTAPTIDKKKLYAFIATESAFYIGGMSYLHYVWYKDTERVPFHFYDDSKGYHQIDKCGHAYGAYVESNIAYKWLLNAGLSKRKAALFGAPMGLLMQTPIEVFDGMYDGWGFSWSDMAANTLGASLVAVNALCFKEPLIHYKFSFYRSTYADLSPEYLGTNFIESIFYDYNGHTYWLSASIHKMLNLKQVPKWISFTAGYSANGMIGEFKNYSYYAGRTIPTVERYRQFLFSLDVDWQQIPTKNKTLKTIFKVLNYVKVPFPAIELSSQGKLKAYPIYF